MLSKRRVKIGSLTMTYVDSTSSAIIPDKTLYNPKKREALLMSTHNICFNGDIREILRGYSI